MQTTGSTPRIATPRHYRLLIALIAIGLVGGLLQPAMPSLAFTFTAVNYIVPSAPTSSNTVQVNVTATAASGEWIGIQTTVGNTVSRASCVPSGGDQTSSTWNCGIPPYSNGTQVTYTIYAYRNGDTNCGTPSNCTPSNFVYGYIVSDITTTPHQVFIDGVNDFRSNETMETSNGIVYYFTWDNNNFYVLFNGADVTSNRYNIGFDTDPGGSNGSSACWGGATFPQYGRPDYVVQFNGSTGTASFGTPNGTDAWNQVITNSITLKSNPGVNNIEMSIPRSILGNLSPSAPLGIYLYVSYLPSGQGCSNERTLSFSPSINPISSSATVKPFEEFFYPTTDNNRIPGWNGGVSGSYALEQLDLYNGVSLAPSSGSIYNDISFEGGILSLNTGFVVNVKRNWSYYSGTFNQDGGIVKFNGSGAQTITGPSTFTGLNIENTGSGVTLAGIITTTNGITITPGAILNGGNAQLIMPGGAILANNGVFNGGNGVVTFNGTGSVGGSGQSVFNNVMLNGTVNFGSNSTISNTLQINVGGSITGTTPNYGNASTLRYNTGSILTTGMEWLPGIAGGPTIPQNVLVANSTTLTLGVSDRTLRGTMTITNGSILNSTGGNLFIGGDFVKIGTFNPNNGTLQFNGAITQNLTLNSPTTLNNLTVVTGTTLVETVAADNANVAGTLANYGTIRKSQPVTAPGRLTFGLTNVAISVTTPGMLTALQVDRIDKTPPNPAPQLQKDKYWIISPTGSGYTVDLALPLPATITDTLRAQACRYTGSVWDCNRTTADSTTVTRTGVSQLSPWAVAGIMPSAPVITKTFTPSTVPLTGTTTLEFAITNPNQGVDLHNIVFSDTLQGLQVAGNPNIVNNCRGTFVATAGSTAISLSGVSLAANGACTVRVNLQPTVAGTISNTTGVATADESGSGNPSNTAILNSFGNPPLIQTGFTPNTIPVNGSTTITFTISNPNNAALSGVTFTDTMPAALKIATPVSITNSCNGSITANAGTSTISLADGTLGALSSCTISVTITADTGGIYPNTTAPVDAAETPVGAQSNTAVLTVIGTPVISKAFIPATAPVTSTITLSFTLTNPNGTATATGIAFTDTLPSGLKVATVVNLVTDCNGVLTATPGSASISYSGGSLAPSQSCTIKLNVVGSAPGLYQNTTGQISSSNAGTGSTSNTATLTLVGPPLIHKSLSSASASVKDPITLTFTITNTNSTTALSGVAFTDNLTSNLAVAANPNPANTCGGSLNAVAGSSTISLTGGAIPANSVCTIRLMLSATRTGTLTNTTGPVSTNEGGTGQPSNTASVTLTETVSAPLIGLSFSPAQIPRSGTATLHFTITNTNVTKDLHGISFTDNLTDGLKIAATPNTTSTCGGTLSAAANGTQIKLTGGQLNAMQTCTISVDITATTAGTKTNATGAISSTESGQGQPSNMATLVVVAPPQISIAFTPAAIGVGGIAELSFTLSNPNQSVALSGIGFTDLLPAGLQVAASPGVQNTCGGNVSAAGGNITLSNGSLAAGATCTISVNITGTTIGFKDNTSGAASSLEGGTGDPSNTARLLVGYQVFTPLALRSANPGW